MEDYRREGACIKNVCEGRTLEKHTKQQESVAISLG